MEEKIENVDFKTKLKLEVGLMKHVSTYDSYRLAPI